MDHILKIETALKTRSVNRCKGCISSFADKWLNTNFRPSFRNLESSDISTNQMPCFIPNYQDFNMAADSYNNNTYGI